MKLGCAEKHFFKLFFSRMLGLLTIHPKSICGEAWGPETLFSSLAWRKRKLCRKTIFQAPILLYFIFRACLGCFQSTQKVAQRDSHFRLSRMKSATLTIVLQEPCFQGMLLSGYLSFLWLQRAGFSMGCSCGKTIFQALIFFPRIALLKLRQARLCKNQFFRL